MKYPFKVKNAEEKLKKSAAELEKAFDRIIEEEEKRQLNVRCTSLEIENDNLRRELHMLKGENAFLTEKKRELQQKLNSERHQRMLSSRYAQQRDFEIAELKAYIKNHCKEVNSSGTDSSM